MSVAAHFDTSHLALFAMQALEAEQSEAVEEHLGGCAFCRQELARLQGDLAAFAHTVQMRPPAASVRDRVLHTVAREKKTPPPEPRSTLVLPVAPAPQTPASRQLATEARDQNTDELDTLELKAAFERVEAWRMEDREEPEEHQVFAESSVEARRSPWQDKIEVQARVDRDVELERASPASPQPERELERPLSSPMQAPEEHESPLLHSHRRNLAHRAAKDEDHPGKTSGGFTVKLFLVLGWVTALCLSTAGGWLYFERETLRTRMVEQTAELDHLKAEDGGTRRLLETITDPSTRQALLTDASEASTDSGRQGRILYSSGRGALLFLGSGLKQLPVAKTYELWLVPADGRDPIPAGVFHPDAKEAARVILPPLPRGIEAKAFGVTIEDEGGAQAPTLPIILAGD